MHQRDARDKVLVEQVGVKIGYLPGLHHALVDDSLIRKARHIDVSALLLHRLLNALSQHKEAHVGGQLIFRPSKEQLFDGRHICPRAIAAGMQIRRHRSPADAGKRLFFGDLFNLRLCVRADIRLQRQKEHADGVFAFMREREPRLLAKERVRQLQKHARAVAGVGIGSRSAAMRQAYQYFQCVCYNRVRTQPVFMRNEAGPTGVMLKLRPPEGGFLHSPR